MMLNSQNFPITANSLRPITEIEVIKS